MLCCVTQGWHKAVACHWGVEEGLQEEAKFEQNLKRRVAARQASRAVPDVQAEHAKCTELQEKTLLTKSPLRALCSLPDACGLVFVPLTFFEPVIPFCPVFGCFMGKIGSSGKVFKAFYASH